MYTAALYTASVQVHLLHVHEPDAGGLPQDRQDLPPPETTQGGEGTDQADGESGEPLAEIWTACRHCVMFIKVGA